MYNHFCNHMEGSIEFLSLWTLTWVKVIRVVRNYILAASQLQSEPGLDSSLLNRRLGTRTGAHL